MKDVAKKLESGEWKRITVTKRGSTIWHHFNKISTGDGKEILPIAMCKYCDHAFKYPKGSSTSNLKKHKCSKREIEVEETNSQFSKKQCVKIHETIKQKVIEKCANFVTSDLRSFEAIAGSGFKDLASCLIDVGAELRTKNFNINDILPHPTTVSRHLKKQHENGLAELTEILKPIIMKRECAATMDIWTESHTQKSFLTFTVHFIDELWNLRRHVLFTEFLPNFNADGEEQKKTAENIISMLKAKFSSLGFEGEDILGQFRYTTDQGSNIKKALKDFSRRNCIAHVLNNVLQNTFDIKKLQSKAPATASLIQKSKSLVEYLKRSGKVQKLDKNVVQDCKSRWNTKYDMLLSIYDNFEEIEKLLEETEPDRLIGINKHLLNKLIAVLKPFKTATLALEGDRKPTIHAVIFQITILKEKITEMSRNEINKEIIFILKNLLENLSAKFEIDDFFKIAAFLWPEYKQLRYMQEDARIQTEELVIENLQRIKANEVGNPHSYDVSSTAMSVEESTSNSENDTYFNKYRDIQGENNMELSFEVQKYKSTSGTSPNDVLRWWKNHATDFPYLSQLAKQVLAIPASSASSERCFSAAGRIMEERRLNLGTQNLDAILFLHAQK